MHFIHGRNKFDFELKADIICGNIMRKSEQIGRKARKICIIYFVLYIRRYSQGGAQAEIMCKIGKRVLTKGGRGDIINKLSGDGERDSGGEKPGGKREKVF